MGSGCFKAPTASEPLLESGASSNPRLAPVLRAAGRAGKCSQAELDQVLEILAGAEADGPEATAEWLCAWLAKPASARGRQGLVALMQRLFTRCLDSRLKAAQEAVKAAGGGDAAEGVDFGHIASRCEESLTLERTQSQGLLSACIVLTQAAQLAGGLEPASDCFVPTLDGIIQLFHRAFIGQRAASSATHLTQLREFESETGLPPIQDHLALLSSNSKSLLLGLLLVPQETPPVSVVIARDGSITDLETQLPDSYACVLMPYFEAASGSKTVQGRRVEGGEGHGLRKEFFTAMSTDALRRWKAPSSASGSGDGVACVGNRIKLGTQEAANAAPVNQLLLSAQVGDKLRLIFADSVEVERVATNIMTMPTGGTSLVVDKSFEEAHEQSVLSRCEVQRPSLALFEFHRGTGQQWFTANASLSGSGAKAKELEVRFSVFGKLLALAIVNHCKLSFALPIMFFQVLLQKESTPSLDDLKGFDNVLHASLKKILKMKATQFKQLKELEDMPEAMTPEEYVAQQVKEILVPKAMVEIRRGFWALVPPDIIRDVAPSELRQIVCPTIPVNENMGIRQLFRVVFEDDMAECQPLIDALWAVFDGLTKVEKTRFLLFVTGVEAPPEPGMEQLTVQMPFSAFTQDEHVALLGMLPQAHTCTNTLELPNYYESLLESGRFALDDDGKPIGEAAKTVNAELKKLLKERLITAISETDSYELDATGGEAVSCTVTPSSVAASGPLGPPRAALPWEGKDKSPETATPSEAASVATLGLPRLRQDADSNSPSWDGQQLTARSLQSIPDGAPIGTLLPRSAMNVAPMATPKMDIDTLIENLEEVPSARDSRPPSGVKRFASAAKSRQGQDVDSLLEDLDAALTTVT
eukprot:TRINITY_DN17140_c0_g1_i1.p1 TRINITY_DN17140_c0_g1~~TRINITY_DN17140_c0_g1_i1.p1  ORF type:complete len:871 (-),score=186.39 TRINITY_DN17140_c0_g1_i1:281-2893(-)